MLLQQLHRRRQQLANNGGTTQQRIGQLYRIGRLNQGNGGSDPEDWTEFALNEFGTTPEELSFLANRRYRLVVKYEGSLSNSDLGDVQMTNGVWQDINNNQAFNYKTQIIEFSQTTNPSTVYTSGSTDLENYINQTWQSIPFYEDGETQTSADEGVFHRAWVLNRAVKKLSTCQNIVVMDSDLVVTNGWATEVLSSKKQSIAWGLLHFLSKEGTEEYQYLSSRAASDEAVELIVPHMDRCDPYA